MRKIKPYRIFPAILAGLLLSCLPDVAAAADYNLGDLGDITLGAADTGSITDGLNIFGTGTATLTGSHTFTGPISVTGSTLSINGVVGRKGTTPAGVQITVSDGGLLELRGGGNDVTGYYEGNPAIIALTDSTMTLIGNHHTLQAASLTDSLINASNSHAIFDNKLSVYAKPGATAAAPTISTTTADIRLRYDAGTTGDSVYKKGGEVFVDEFAQLNVTYRWLRDGTAVLTKTGKGVMNLNASSNPGWNGDTVVNEGTLMLSKGGTTGSLASGSTLTINENGTVRLAVNDALGYTTTAVGTVNINGGTLLVNNATHSTLNCAINMTGGLITSPDKIAGDTVADGNFILDKPINVLAAEGADADNPTVATIDAHLIRVRSGGEFNVAANAELVIDGTLGGSAGETRTVLKTGDGTLVLRGNNDVLEKIKYGTAVRESGTLSNALQIGVDSADSDAVYELAGGTLAGRIFLGYFSDGSTPPVGASGTLRVTGGTIDNTAVGANGDIWIADTQNSAGLLHLVDGTINTNRLTVGQRGTGEFIQDGGTVTIDYANAAYGLYVGHENATANGTGTYTLNGGLMDTNRMWVRSGSTFNLDGGNLVAGTITLENAANFNLNAGSLQAVTVNNADAVRNTGATVNVTGIADADNNLSGSIPSLGFSGGYVQESGGTLLMEIFRSTDGTYETTGLTADSIDLDGTLELLLTGTWGDAAIGEEFPIADFFSGMADSDVSGAFSGLVISSLSVMDAPFAFTYDSLGYSGILGVSDQQANATPEPATWLLLATGLLGLGIYRRKK